MVDFIGLGAQKSGTSWIYACLYEHPEICAPIKEIHYFSRNRFTKGKEWYESHFSKCTDGKVCGEFSTSYLYSKEAPARIHGQYPNVKLIAVLRNPIDRAFSQYRNVQKAGEIEQKISFDEYIEAEESVLQQGLYAEQLERYYKYFKNRQILVLIHEDCRRQPDECIKRIYTFLEVRDTFVPSMLHREINVARMPKYIIVEKLMHRFAEGLRRLGFDGLVHRIRQMGLPDMVRLHNTKKITDPVLSFDRTSLQNYFRDDIRKLSKMIDRDVTVEWDI